MENFDDPMLEPEERDFFIPSDVHNLGTLSPPASVSSYSTENLSVNPSDIAPAFPVAGETSMKCSSHNLQFEDADEQIACNVVHHQGRHICSMCDKSYVHKNNLDDHVQTHYGNFYYCEHKGCNKRFGTLHGLELHAVKHAGSSFECTICHRKFASQEKLEPHMHVHLNKKWKCELCGKKLAWKSDMQKHINKNCPNRQINLTSASESESSVNGSSRSLRSRNSDLEILQVVPGASKRAAPAAENNSIPENGVMTKKEKPEKFRTHHERQVKKAPYSCSTCVKWLTTKDNLKKHYRTVHKRELIYVCQNCLTGFPSRNALFDHKRVGSCKQSGKKNLATFEKL